ncbi:39S ribosomal protein L52, mitochondrial isoform X1 [Arapaima gigas]
MSDACVLKYGPLTDLPDWSFADGRPAPPLKGQRRRQREREEFVRRVVEISTEMEMGLQKWREKKEAKKVMEEMKKSQLLDPKGKLLLKNKK